MVPANVDGRCARRFFQPNWIVDYSIGAFITGGLVGLAATHLGLWVGRREKSRPPRVAGRSSERASREFLARMGHELRTPLNSVIGFAAILLKNAERNLGTRQLLYLSRIHDNGVHLLALVDHLLESGLEGGGPHVRLTPVSVAQVVRGTVHALGDQATQDNVTVETEIPLDLAPITTDEHRFELALQSLVRGALPLAERGTVTVRVAALDRRPARIEVAVTRTPAVDDGETRRASDTSARRKRKLGPLPAEVSLATSLYHLLGYTLTTEQSDDDTSTFSVRLAPSAPTA